MLQYSIDKFIITPYSHEYNQKIPKTANKPAKNIKIKDALLKPLPPASYLNTVFTLDIKN